MSGIKGRGLIVGVASGALGVSGAITSHAGSQLNKGVFIDVSCVGIAAARGLLLINGFSFGAAASGIKRRSPFS